MIKSALSNPLGEDASLISCGIHHALISEASSPSGSNVIFIMRCSARHRKIIQQRVQIGKLLFIGRTIARGTQNYFGCNCCKKR